ncbi:MAG: methyltransferase domain-containing protein [Acidimicrobiia bacterium]|nr:methyltransferase domain-containing protein [Acidimicrobiia bacterium]
MSAETSPDGSPQTGDAGPPATELDPEALKLFALKVWSYKMGEVVSLMIHLGDRLGLYRAMAGSGPLTGADLADRTGLDARLVEEWLLGQAAADLMTRHDDGRFELDAVSAALLADESGSVDFAAGAFQGGTPPEVVDALARSFDTGVGITYEEQGAVATAGLARMNAPRTRQTLVTEVLPAVDGLTERLTAGTRVVEIGCGGGVALATIAAAFPNSTFIGIDPSPTAVELARQQARVDSLTNVSFIEGFATDIDRATDDGPAGLVLAFDCLHDMPRPDRALAAVRDVLADDGILLVKEIRCTGDFDRDRRNPLLALLYGFSVTSCLQSALSEADGLGLGTVGLHGDRLTDMATAAGFGSVTQHDLGEPNNLYYDVRP